MDEIKRAYQSLRAHLIGALRIFAALFLNLAQHLELTSRGLFADVQQKDLSRDLEWMSFIIRGELGVARDPARSDFFFNTEARFKSYWVKEDRGHACGFSDSLGRWLPYVARKLQDQICYLRLAVGSVTINGIDMAGVRVFALFLALFLADSFAIT